MENISWKPQLYNDKHAFVYQYGESLIELLLPQPGERILDLGCGSGQLTAKIKERAEFSQCAAIFESLNSCLEEMMLFKKRCFYQR